MGIFIYGRDEKKLFSNAAYAFKKIIAGDRKIAEKQREKVELDYSDLEMGLFQWMSELLFLYDSRAFLPNRVEFELFSRERLKATLYGDIFTFQPKVYIKAITMHKLKIEKTPSGLRARIIIDL